MRKLIIAALAVLVLAAPALASQASTSASSPFRSIADTITGQGVLVVVGDGVIALKCLRHGQDALRLAPRRGGYAAFCQ